MESRKYMQLFHSCKNMGDRFTLCIYFSLFFPFFLLQAELSSYFLSFLIFPKCFFSFPPVPAQIHQSHWGSNELFLTSKKVTSFSKWVGVRVGSTLISTRKKSAQMNRLSEKKRKKGQKSTGDEDIVLILF